MFNKAVINVTSASKIPRMILMAMIIVVVCFLLLSEELDRGMIREMLVCIEEGADAPRGRRDGAWGVLGMESDAEDVAIIPSNSGKLKINTSTNTRRSTRRLGA